MDMTDPQWDRLGQFVRQGRTQLGLSQKALSDRGGPSDTTIGKIEAGEWRPKRGVTDTLDKIDTAMGWTAGSSSHILAGGNPVPLPSESVGATPIQQTNDEADYLIDVDVTARAIKLIGDQLLAAMPTAASDIAGALSELADEYAQTLLAAVEENPLRRTRLAEPYTAAVMAARHFWSIHDAPTPARAYPEPTDKESGTATGASVSGADHVWKGQSPDKGAPRKRG